MRMRLMEQEEYKKKTHLFVECLKDILSMNKPEKDHYLIQESLQLILCRFLITSSELAIHKFSCKK